MIDEAHRSVYQRFRAVFDYFDAFLVGLTATPKDEIDKNTYSLFDLEDGVPTDAYSLAEAVEAGYLVPPQAISVPLKIVRQGLHYDDLTEAEKDQWDSLEWSEDEIPDTIQAAEVNKRLFNTDTVDHVIAHLMENGVKVEGGDRLGKTIVFAKNQGPRRFHRKALRQGLSQARRHVRARNHPPDRRLCANADRCLREEGERAAYRDLGRHARHRHRRARGRQPRPFSSRCGPKPSSGR